MAKTEKQEEVLQEVNTDVKSEETPVEQSKQEELKIKHRVLEDGGDFKLKPVKFKTKKEKSQEQTGVEKAVEDQKTETEDIKAGQAGTIMKEETAAQSTVSLDQQLAAMGGSQQAIADIQQETFQEVKGASDKEKMEIRKRKEQQLQRAIRQRRKSGFQGRRSLITGQSGGRGYA